MSKVTEKELTYIKETLGDVKAKCRSMLSKDLEFEFEGSKYHRTEIDMALVDREDGKYFTSEAVSLEFKDIDFQVYFKAMLVVDHSVDSNFYVADFAKASYLSIVEEEE